MILKMALGHALQLQIAHLSLKIQHRYIQQEKQIGRSGFGLTLLTAEVT